jgi:Rap1a immunity proteins
MKAIIVLVAVIDAELLVFVYHQESSDPPATPSYSVQGESAREASTGNDIQVWCESEPLTAQVYIARIWKGNTRTDFTFSSQKGYSGIVDAAEPHVGYCVPAGLTLKQVTDAYCRFLQDNPEKRSAPGALLFTEAMTGAWPCDTR